MTKYSTYIDEQLIELLKKSDESAFHEIYERHWEVLFGMAFNRLQSVPESEDAVHEIFLALWSRRDQIQIISLKSYLATALKYTVLRIIYRKKLSDAFVRSVSKDNPMLDAQTYLENKNIIENILLESETLPEKCKIIFQLSRIHGFSNNEIAQKLDVTVKTVENQINKAQARLRLSIKNFLSLLIILLFSDFLQKFF